MADQYPQWQPVANLGSILGDDFGDGLETFVSSITTTLNTVAAIIELIGELAIITVDVTTALIENTLSLLENFILDLLGTGCYVLPIYPTSPSDVITYAEWLDTWTSSWFDTGDPFRPQFSFNAPIAGFTLFAAAPSIEDFKNQLSLLIALFGTSQFKNIYDNYNLWSTEPILPRPRQQMGVEPNWQGPPIGITISDLIEPLGDITKAVELIVSAIRSAKKTTQMIEDFADLISSRILELSYIIARFSDLIKRFTDALLATGGYYIGYGLTTGGSLGYVTAMQSAGNVPDFTINSYIASVTVITGTGNISIFDNIFSFEEIDILPQDKLDEITARYGTL